jgi:hypothetical protein
MQELKQIQEENRKAIIMACNPEAKTYEEALELELNRVLIALSEKLYQLDSWQEIYKTELHFLKMVRYCDARIEESIIFKWDLTKETLEEQSEKVQREINKLLICNKKI